MGILEILNNLFIYILVFGFLFVVCRYYLIPILIERYKTKKHN